MAFFDFLAIFLTGAFSVAAAAAGAADGAAAGVVIGAPVCEAACAMDVTAKGVARMAAAARVDRNFFILSSSGCDEDDDAVRSGRGRPRSIQRVCLTLVFAGWLTFKSA